MTERRTMLTQAEIQEAYREFFREQVHYLIFIGLQGCKSKLRSSQEEEEVSDFLCQSIQEYLESVYSPEWCYRYCVINEHPESGGKRTGKRRKRKDIVFQYTETKPRLWYIFEAKRLDQSHSCANYFKTGLFRFIEGIYASAYSEAGMLGYVQDDTSLDWNSDLKGWLKQNVSEARCIEIVSSKVINEFPDEWSSIHDRRIGTKVTIFHLLIDFHLV